MSEASIKRAEIPKGYFSSIKIRGRISRYCSKTCAHSLCPSPVLIPSLSNDNFARLPARDLQSSRSSRTTLPRSYSSRYRLPDILVLHPTIKAFQNWIQINLCLTIPIYFLQIPQPRNSITGWDCVPTALTEPEDSVCRMFHTAGYCRLHVHDAR